MLHECFLLLVLSLFQYIDIYRQMIFPQHNYECYFPSQRLLMPPPQLNPLRMSCLRVNMLHIQPETNLPSSHPKHSLCFLSSGNVPFSLRNSRINKELFQPVGIKCHTKECIAEKFNRSFLLVEVLMTIFLK